jgi:hypothetical protein
MPATNDAPGDVIFHRPGVAIVRWDAACKAVWVEWQGWANPHEFAETLEAGLVALVDHRGSCWLADCRGMKAIQQSDQEWIDRNWFPRALAAGMKRMATILPISGLAKMNLEDIMSKVPVTKLNVGFFATVAEGRTWLTAQSTKTPTGLRAMPVS